jgi:hypothetical protein
MAAGHELGEARLVIDELVLLAFECQLVPAQENAQPETVAQGSEDAVIDGCELSGDLVGDGENFLQRTQCRARSGADSPGKAVCD